MTDESPAPEQRFARLASGSPMPRADWAAIWELARVRPSTRLLDAATGSGLLALEFAEHVAQCVGVDPSREALARAMSEARADADSQAATTHAATARKTRPEFVCADVAALPFADASFDCAVTRRGPHHFPNIEESLRELARVLEAGGRLAIDDRSGPEDDDADDLMNRLDKLHAPSHVRQFRPSAWRDLLERAGFAIERIDPYERDLPIEVLLDGSPAGAAEEILSLLANASDQTRHVLHHRVDANGVWLRHHYVRIAARRR